MAAAAGAEPGGHVTSGGHHVRAEHLAEPQLVPQDGTGKHAEQTGALKTPARGVSATYMISPPSLHTLRCHLSTYHHGL